MTDYLGDPGPVDEISQDSGFSRPQRARRNGSAPPGAKLTALTTALAVVLAGGVVTAAWRSFQSHDAPERLVPASAFAIATLDLGMRGQSDALSTFADHFPSSPTHRGSGSAVDRLLRAIFRGSSDPHVDYDRDIKPWLGDRVAIAGWLDKAGKPQIEGLLESTDDGAARRELGRLIKHGDGAYDFSDGYAVVGNNDAAVQAAIAAAHRSSLADSATYAADLDALPGEPALTGWLDGPAAHKALLAALGPGEARMLDQMGYAGPFGPFGPLGLLGSAGAVGVGGVGDPGFGAAGAAAQAAGSPAQMFAGRTALGVRVDDRYIEVDTRSTGAAAQHQTSTDTLRALPAATIAALEIGDPSSLVNGVTSMLKGFGGVRPLGVMCTSEAGGATAMPSTVPLGTPHRKQIVRELARMRKQMRHQMRQNRQRNNGCTSDAFRPPNPLAEIERATGLRLPADAITVLGDSVLASYGGLSLTGVPKVAVRTHPADISAAQKVLDTLQNRLGSSSPVPLSVDTSGDDLVLATSSDYAHAVEQPGTLGQQSAVELAMGDLPDAVSAAGYVDLSKILPLIDALPRDLQALKEIGFWTSGDGGVQRSQLRVVVG